MPICGDAFDLYTQLNEVIQVFFDLPVMFAVGKSDQLGVAIVMILVAQKAELLKIGGIQPQVDLWPLQDLHGWSLCEKGIESLLKRIDGQAAVTAQGLKGLPFQHPFSEPDKTILQTLNGVVTGKKNTAVLALEPLFSGLLPPPDHC